MTRKNVYIFNLQKQAIVKKLQSGADWNSSLAIHPYGDNIVVGSEDKKVIKIFNLAYLVWFRYGRKTIQEFVISWKSYHTNWLP
jgi:WD40 repeat protein